QLHDRVERRAGRLATDPLPDILAMLAERQRQREDLRYALDREGLATIARRIDAPTDARHGNAELSRIDMSKLRNVIRDLSLPEPRRQLTMNLVDDRLQIFHVPVLSAYSNAAPERWLLAEFLT